jgi:hypothetical protein
MERAELQAYPLPLYPGIEKRSDSMERLDAASGREHREFLKQEQQFMRQIMFVADRAFTETTEAPSAFDLRLPDARQGDQAEDGFVRPLPWEYLFREAAE